MTDEQPVKHKPKKDRYTKARGGSSNFLDLYCTKCDNHLLLYQKDGPGSLLRLYLDRIFEPDELADFQYKNGGKSALPNLRCPDCGSLIGTPMVYKPEGRLAFRLQRGSFSKKRSDGIYPPPSESDKDKEE